jgi:DnaK suppressor protein
MTVPSWEEDMTHSHAPAPLTRTELATLTRALHAEQRRLQERASIPSLIAQADPRDADPSDEAVESRAEDEALAGSRQARDLLAEVEAALARIEDGTYGTSERSGKPIGYERLSAVPWARLTAAEQEERDRTGGPEPAR